MNKMSPKLSKLSRVLCCPLCKGNTKIDNNTVRCIQCGHTYALDEDIIIFLKENYLTIHSKKQIEIFDRTLKKGSIFIAWMSNYVNRLFQNLNFKKNTLALDIATGNGYIALALAKKGYDVIALDITLSSLLKLRKEAKRQKIYNRVFLICADATNLPIKTGSVDVISANAILEHIPNEAKAIFEIDRVSKKNAGLMISVPLAYKYLWPFLIPINYYHDKKIGHLRRYSKNDLLSKFKLWKLRKVYYTGNIIKVLLFILASIFRIKKLDKLAEKSDEFSLHVPYGASNITVFFTKTSKD